jgi:hypothetical protein
MLAVLGLGIMGELVPHIPQKEKKPGHGIPGPEQNALVSTIKKIGPYLFHYRSSTRSLHRELVRAMDQLTRTWNLEKGATKIQEMPQVRAERIGKDHRLLHEVLADIEESKWLAKNFAPKDALVFRRPSLHILKDDVSARKALLTRGFEIKTYTAEPEQCEPGVKTNNPSVPKAKIGFWRVTSLGWDAKREMLAKRMPARPRRPACLVDGLQVICEARELFRRRLLEREMEWIRQKRQEKLEQDRQRAAEEKTVAVPGPPVVLRRLPPLIPPELIVAAEKAHATPLQNSKDARLLFARLNHPVRAHQPDRASLELGAGTRQMVVPQHEVLVVLQLALLRGLLLSHHRAAQAEFYFVMSQPGDFGASEHKTLMLDPFDACWQEAYEVLKNPMHQDDWYDALLAVKDVTQKNPKCRPTTKAALFFQYLHTKVGMRSSVAFVLTSLHFRSSSEPFASFTAGLQQEIQTLGLPAAILPATAKANDPRTVVAPLPPFPGLPKAPMPTPDFRQQEKRKEAKELDRENELTQKRRQAPHREKQTVEQVKTKVHVAKPEQANDQTASRTAAQPVAPPQAAVQAPPRNQPRARTQLPPHEFIPLWFIPAMQKDDTLPQSAEDVEKLARRADVTIAQQTNSDELVLRSKADFESVVDRSTLKLSLALAIVYAGLPKDARATGGHPLKFQGASNVTPNKAACERVLQELEEYWPLINRAWRQPELKEVWTSAFRTSAAEPDGNRRLELIFRSLIKAGIDANLAMALVLSQLRGDFRQLDPLVNKMDAVAVECRASAASTKQASIATKSDPLALILHEITAGDTLPESVDALQTLARRAGVLITAVPQEESEDVVLQFAQDELHINRDELTLYVGLAAINASLPRDASRSSGCLLDLATGDIVPADDRGFVSWRWLKRIRDNWEELQEALSNPKLMRTWAALVNSTRNTMPDRRAINLYSEMVDHDASADVALLLVASQVGARLDAVNSLSGKLPIRSLE